MKVKYKRVKKLMPHCGECGEELLGNNSDFSPYRCKCGIWKSSFSDPFNFELWGEITKGIISSPIEDKFQQIFGQFKEEKD